MNNLYKCGILIVIGLSLVIFGQVDQILQQSQPPQDKEKDKNRVQQIKECDIGELVTKIKSLPKKAEILKDLESDIEKEYNPRTAIAYAYLLKNVEQKYFDGWKKLLAVLRSLVTKEDMDTKLVRAIAQIAIEMSDAAFTEEEEGTIKDKLNEIFEKNTDPFVSIYLARAYQNLFVGDIKGINEIKKVLKESHDTDARFWAGVHLVELDITDEPLIATIMEKVVSDEKESIEKKKLAEFVLNTMRLKRKLEERGDEIPPSTKPTSFKVDKFRKIEKLMNLITRHYAYKENIKEKDLIEACAKGIGDSLDAYSGYMDINQTKRLTESVNMRYAGIGAVVSMRDGWLTIEQPIYNGPAYKAGLRGKDRIVKVEDEYTKGKTIEELVAKLKGPPGTQVKILVIRAGWEKEREFTITREIISMGTVKFTLISPDVAYFRIISFGSDTVHEFLDGVRELGKMSSNKLKAVIIDVRDNSGGYLDSVLKLLNYFIPAGKAILTAKGDAKIAETEEEDREFDREFFEVKTSQEKDVLVKTIYANDRVKKFNFKNIYVLVDEGTASAAEIFAGALHDYALAKLIGTTTYGKGSIQQIFDLGRDGETIAFLRLTIGRYFLPSGKSIHANRDKFGVKPKDANGGIEPDVVIDKKEPDYWVLFEKEKLSQNKKLIDYIDKLTTDNFELARNLAINDNKNYKNYPAFNTLYKSLKTKLPKNNVREVLRSELRKKVMDIQGKEIIYDAADDLVLEKLFDIIATDLSLSKENLGFVNKELPAKTPAIKNQ